MVLMAGVMRVAWFTSIRADGTPNAVPVWFLWHDGRVLVLSEADTLKVRTVRRGSPVLVHLHAGGAFGDDVVVLHGSAEVSDRSATQWAETIGDASAAKSAEGIAELGIDVPTMLSRYNTVSDMTPERLQAW
mgnify:CR=1 FL=1